MKTLTAIVIGAGNRGGCYSRIMAKTPDKYKVVAIAEPLEERRNYVKNLYNIEDNLCFTDYEPLFAKGKIADFAVIASMDRMHLDCALRAIELGYDLLLEKPIAPTLEECVKITDAANKKGVRVIICTVLRYTNLFRSIKNIILSGRIGDVVSINHEECVGNVHQSHSFVRGNWGNSERSSDMLLQKSSHDIDLLQWLIDKKCKKIQSFGSLSYFKRANAPEGSPEYCIEGCPNGEKCPYNAVKLYFDDKGNDWFRGAATGLRKPTDDAVKDALINTQYGKCVYKCDNNVVDHQVVNMLFEDDITVSFTMNAFNRGGRYIHIMGTKGELRASLDKDEKPLTIYDFETKEVEEIAFAGADGITNGHGGGDDGIIEDLYDYLIGEYSGNSIPTISESLYNHFLVFAAEESRLSNTIVDVENFIKEALKTN